MDGTTGQPSYAELAALVALLQVELAALRAENQQLKRRIAELEKKNLTPRLDKSYSMKAEKSGRRKRRRTPAKRRDMVPAVINRHRSDRCGEFATGKRHSLSMDKVCTLLKFFWQLELSKSQADVLLNQLSRQWEVQHGVCPPESRTNLCSLEISLRGDDLQ